MGKDHGGDFLFPYQIEIKSSALVADGARLDSSVRNYIDAVRPHVTDASSWPSSIRVVRTRIPFLFPSFLVRLSARIDRSPSRDSTTDTLVLVNSTEAHHFLIQYLWWLLLYVGHSPWSAGCCVDSRRDPALLYDMLPFPVGGSFNLKW